MKLPCDCCKDNAGRTPIPIYNQPGQNSLMYRVGTHAAFFESMIARLSSVSYPELAELTTRDLGDFSVAMLDAWATVADVLTFYQERIANEGYLRTATERRSILELARIVGYTLRLGVASSVYLAYELEKDYEVEIPAGERVQSLPAAGEFPQSFETSEPLSARAEWNAIRPRTTRPQNIKIEYVEVKEKSIPKTIPLVYLEGTATNLKQNDKVILDFGNNQVLQTVNKVTIQPSNNRTEVCFEPIGSSSTFIKSIVDVSTGAFSLANNIKIEESVGLSSSTIKISDLFIELSKPPNPQPAGSQYLNRDINKIFKNSSDVLAQTLVNLKPQISKTFYPALSSINIGDENESLKGVYVLRIRSALFGYNALPPRIPIPIAKFKIDADPNDIYAGDTLSFTDLSTGTPTKWNWDFDDGATSTDQNPKHMYDKGNGLGTRNIKLSVENAGGASTATWTITVKLRRKLETNEK